MNDKYILDENGNPVAEPDGETIISTVFLRDNIPPKRSEYGSACVLWTLVHVANQFIKKLSQSGASNLITLWSYSQPCLLARIAALNVITCQAQIGIPCLLESCAIPTGNVIQNHSAFFSDTLHGYLMCFDEFIVRSSVQTVTRSGDNRTERAFAIIPISSHSKGVGNAGDNEPAKERQDKTDQKNYVRIHCIPFLIMCLFAGMGARICWLAVVSRFPNVMKRKKQ